MNKVFQENVVFGLLLVLGVLAQCSPSTDRSEAWVAPPEGMVFVPGGEVDLGSEEGRPDEWGGYEVALEPFFMDIHPVTVAQFREFVEATGYVTEAENFGDAAVLHEETGVWELRGGAYWQYPLGMAYEKAPDDHPVTQVSWNDAQAYCTWKGGRLPTEAEWEHAAKNATNSEDRFPWGESVMGEKGYLANYWQGAFPSYNEVLDGYRYTSPVGKFGPTALGLTDMAGNVWEWCQDNYILYLKHDRPYDPKPTSERVQRGGSFLCDTSVCFGFRNTGRSHSTPDSALFHVGFRMVKDIPEAERKS